MLLALVLDTLGWSIGDPHPNGGKTGFQSTLGPVSPTHILPLGIGQHVFGRRRQYIGNVPLAGTTSTGDRPDQFNPDRINLLVTRDTDGPGQAACREPLTERRAETVSSICQHTAETPARFKRAGLLVQLSGTKRRNATTGERARTAV